MYGSGRMADSKLPRKSRKSRDSRSSNEIEIDNQETLTKEEEELIRLQMSANQYLYDQFSEVFQVSAENVDDESATGVVVSAAATNLGIIIAQMSPASSENYLKIAHEILDTSFSVALQTIHEKKYGQVGHA